MCCRYWNMRATSSFGILKRQPWFWSRYVEKSFSVMPLRFWGGRWEIELLPCELLAFFPFISILGLLRGLVQTLCIEFMSTLCPDIQEQHSLGYVPHPPRPKLDVMLQIISKAGPVPRNSTSRRQRSLIKSIYPSQPQANHACGVNVNLGG